jgi:hypothetical protein
MMRAFYDLWKSHALNLERWFGLRSAVVIGLLAASVLAAAEPPTIPVGLDAYRQWERWPYQRIGARAYMRSTYDRTGGNESADASHFFYQESDTFNVTRWMSKARACLVFARYNHWHGSPWHYEVDGQDHLVQETSSADPTAPGRRFDLPAGGALSLTR